MCFNAMLCFIKKNWWLGSAAVDWHMKSIFIMTDYSERNNYSQQFYYLNGHKDFHSGRQIAK